MHQSHLRPYSTHPFIITPDLLKAQEKSFVQGVIGFGVASDWHKIFEAITLKTALGQRFTVPIFPLYFCRCTGLTEPLTMTCVDFIQVIILTFLEGIDVQSCMINIAVDLQVTYHMITDPMQTEIIDKR